MCVLLLEQDGTLELVQERGAQVKHVYKEVLDCGQGDGGGHRTAA